MYPVCHFYYSYLSKILIRKKVHKDIQSHKARTIYSLQTVKKLLHSRLVFQEKWYFLNNQERNV